MDIEQANASQQPNQAATAPPVYTERRDRLAAAFALIPDCEQVTIAGYQEWLPHTSKYLFHRAE